MKGHTGQAMQDVEVDQKDKDHKLEIFQKFIQRDRIHPSVLDKFYSDLEPVDFDDLEHTKWRGGYFYTGNNWGLLLSLPVLHWHGKEFRTKDSVDALVFRISKLKFAVPIGKSKLIETEFRGKTSIAMKYDMMPVWDHFRKVSDNFLMGIMDAKLPLVDDFYFYLIRGE